jgi:chromate transporter
MVDQRRGDSESTLSSPPRPHGSALEVLRVAARLGVTSFGGPVAHIGYFHQEYVVRRKWLDERTYADLVALCQFLPGPASSELGIAIGISRAGVLGGVMAWLGFTLPSASAMVLFALLVRHTGAVNAPWLHGLQIVAVAVVALAVWQMGQRLASDRPRITIAVLAAVITLAWPTQLVQVAVIVGAGIVGWRLLPATLETPELSEVAPVGRRLAAACWALFFCLLLGLPIARQLVHNHTLALVDALYRTGSLVFGGGHVVLPLLQAAVVGPGWVTNGQFLAGYGAAQAVPGPLFTFAAYLGAIERPAPNGISGGAVALVAIFLPSFLLVIGTLPFWNVLRTRTDFRSALEGTNASVVGLLLAALYHPIWTTAITSPTTFSLALVSFALLAWWRVPPWMVVLFGAVVAQLLRVH